MANWIGYITNKEYDFCNKKQKYGIPASYFRREFICDKPVKNAIVKLSALGVFSAYLNGGVVNDDFLSPGWTEYEKTVEYFEYDVTDAIVQGKNALGVVLADGWYASNISNRDKCFFGNYPLKLWYRIELTFCDDTKAVIEVDGSEKATDGPIRYCDNQNGIKIDNRFEIGDISSVEYSGKELSPVEVFEYLKPKKAKISPIKEQFRFKGECIFQNEEEILLDFSQNFAGVLDCVFQGQRGDVITILHGETLTEDGDLYTKNLRSALATDTFVLGSDKEEQFFPRCLFHGFRYAKITFPVGVKVVKAEGVAIFSDMERVGEFSCNHLLVNQIYSNVLWGQRGNFLSVPTDCPQRDERLGWTGDAQIFCKTAMFNYNAKLFYEKYLRDMRDSIDIYGCGVPVTVPYVFDDLKSKGEYYIGWMGWSDAVIIIPYMHYLMYGDKSILEKSLPYMKNYLQYIFENSKEYIIDLPSYGDWLSIMEETDKQVYNTVYFAYSAKLLTRICRILGDADEKKYHALFTRIKRAFQEKFICDDKIQSDTQACYILAYSFGLIGKGFARSALKRKLKEFNCHLTTGFHGTKYLLPTLCDLGMQTRAFDLLLREDFPSWGYMIRNGATTFWERWDSYTKEDGFNPNGMNSFNHYSLASCGEWFYTHMLGINPVEDAPGWERVRISPYFDKRISQLSGSYITDKGKISVSIQIEGKDISYKLILPKKVSVAFDFNNQVLSFTEKKKKHCKEYEVRMRLR